MTREIIGHLRGLADGSIEPGIPDRGLCCELLGRFGVEPHHMGGFVAEWPEHTGSSRYPVPHPRLPAGDAFDLTCSTLPDMWNPDLYPDDPDHAEYCRARRRLCSWLADYLEARL